MVMVVCSLCIGRWRGIMKWSDCVLHAPDYIFRTSHVGPQIWQLRPYQRFFPQSSHFFPCCASVTRLICLYSVVCEGERFPFQPTKNRQSK